MCLISVVCVELSPLRVKVIPALTNEAVCSSSGFSYNTQLPAGYKLNGTFVNIRVTGLKS